MRTLIFVVIAAGSLCVVSGAANAQQPFVHRPHYIHERQLIPDRKPNYDTYYLRKYGRLPPYSRPYVAPPDPLLSRGFRWSDTYVPGYGYVPTDLLLD